MRRTPRSDPGTVCRTGPITSPATRWWRRWTKSASTARSTSPRFRFTATPPPSPWKGTGPIPNVPPFLMCRYAPSYAVEVQQANPDRFALVKPVDPDDPAVADVIADWKKTPGAVGVRIMMTKEAGRDPNDPGLDRVLRAAVRYDLPVNMLCWGNVDTGAALIHRHP